MKVFMLNPKHHFHSNYALHLAYCLGIGMVDIERLVLRLKVEYGE